MFATFHMCTRLSVPVSGWYWEPTGHRKATIRGKRELDLGSLDLLSRPLWKASSLDFSWPVRSLPTWHPSPGRPQTRIERIVAMGEKVRFRQGSLAIKQCQVRSLVRIAPQVNLGPEKGGPKGDSSTYDAKQNKWNLFPAVSDYHISVS